MSRTWTVVKFLSDNSVEAVPTSWIISNNICLWPPYASEKVSTSIKKHEPPNSAWDKFKIKIFDNAIYDDYTIARKKMNKAQECSDLESDTDARRKKKSVWSEEFQYTDSEDDELGARQRLPAPPKFSLKDNKSRSKDVGDGDQTKLKGASQEGFIVATSSEINEGVPEHNCTCCPLHENPTDLIKRTVKQITIMSTVLSNIQATLEQLKLPNEETCNFESVFILFNMPLKTEEELIQFEEYLADEGNMKTTVTELSKIGGDTSDEYIKRVMIRLISNQLASEYSWKGLKGKKIIFDKKITNLLVDSAFKNKMTSKCSLKEIEESIKKFLRRSKERALAEEKRK